MPGPKQVYADEARNAEKLDARLKLEEHWLLRGVTGRRKRNQGRLTKLIEMRAERSAMVGPQGAANLTIGNNDAKSKVVIDAKHISKAFGADDSRRTIIGDLSLRVTRKDRIGIVGANGAGKSTLLKLLTGELEPDSGHIRFAKTIERIVIDQQRSKMAPEKTIRDVLADGGDWVEVQGVRKHVIGYLKEFLFEPGVLDAKIATLSGGERSRLLLAREFAKPSNLLVLDEPTNDLDLETLDLLQDVIGDYDGTVLIVSHDRDFLDRTVTITLGLDGSGTVDVVAGGYADWERRRKAAAPTKRGAIARNATAAAAVPAPGTVRTKLTFKDQRDYDLLPKRIETLDAAIARDQVLLEDPDLYTRDPDGFERLMEAIGQAQEGQERRRAALAGTGGDGRGAGVGRSTWAHCLGY